MKDKKLSGGDRFDTGNDDSSPVRAGQSMLFPKKRIDPPQDTKAHRRKSHGHLGRGTRLSLTQQLFDFIVHIMQTLGYSGIFGLMVLESATLPVPSEIVLPFAGYLVYLGTFNFWIVLLVASVGSLVGTLIDYFVGDYLGRAVILRYGRYIHLTENHLMSSEKWFKKYGDIAVLFARFIPLIRTLVAFPAGIAKMKLSSFLAFSIVGIVIYDAALIYVGYIVGPSVNSIINNLSSDFAVVEVLAVIIAAVVLYLWFRRGSKRGSVEKGTIEGQKGTGGPGPAALNLKLPTPSRLSLFQGS